MISISRYTRSLWRGRKKEMKTIHRRPVAFSNSLTGTTVNAYADALDWLCLGLLSKVIHLKNTDGANALKYKVLTYTHAGGLPYEEIAEVVLAVGDTKQIILEYAYAAIKVQVKSSVGGDHATYQLDYNGAKGGG